jgi:hypothetical protein
MRQASLHDGQVTSTCICGAAQPSSEKRHASQVRGFEARYGDGLHYQSGQHCCTMQQQWRLQRVTPTPQSDISDSSYVVVTVPATHYDGRK